MSDRETSAQIDAIAAEWAVRVDEARLDPAEQTKLEHWLAGDPRRLGAYARARAMFQHSRRAKALGSNFNPDHFLLTHAAPDPDLSTTINAIDGNATGLGKLLPRRTVLIGGSGVAAAGALAAFGFAWQAAAHTYTTEQGEIRLVPLSDGSTMTLNTASAARVGFSDSQRHVELIKGEALFDVTQDSRRPFIVDAGNARVHALHTSFTVSRLSRQPVQVLVRQGIVEVELTRSLPVKEVVAANSRATVSDDRPLAIAPVAKEEMSRELAWREGMLSFEDTPLRVAASEFARYSDTRILFEEPAIGDETITGRFSANSPASFASAAALSLGLSVHASPQGVIISR